MSQAKEPLSSVVDVNVPTAARMYDYYLGGTDNFASDRRAAHRVIAEAPEALLLARENRRFLQRAVRFLARDAGIRQFLDIGTGLPTADNTHQVAQRAAPDARVVYVDNDPVVLAHGNALLADNDSTHMVDADIFEPAQVLGHSTVTEHLDFDRPIALLQVSTLHHYTGDLADMMRGYLDALAPGSYFVFSHLLDPETPELTPTARQLEQVALNSSMGSGTFRTRKEMERVVEGWEIVPPGPNEAPRAALCDEWWPDGPKLRPRTATEHFFGCIVARKP